MKTIVTWRGLLLGCSALISMTGLATSAAAAAAPATSSVETVQEIVVTAQRREQNIQSVPVAVTALTAETIRANRVTTVNDLNLLAPGFNVVPTVGGAQIPSFSMRGITSYGVVPGSDKAISMYVDGVYISSGRGSIFDLPDISQIEVLRGPQGTLFGRNATGGAVSVTTRDPTGKFGVEQTFTGGNYGQFRTRTSVDLPAWGDFSGYFSYVHNQRDGDTKNVGGGTVWNYKNVANPDFGTTQISPSTLSAADTNSVFAAVKFATNQFSTVYKFDWSVEHGSPEASAFLGADLSGAAGGILGLLLHTNPVLVAGMSRPDAVNNAFDIERVQRNSGHTLTSVYEGDNFTIKNIAAYRESFLSGTNQLDGLGGLNLTLAPGVSIPFTALALTVQAQNRQWSDELQYILHTKYLTLTVGGLLFQSKDYNGAIPGLGSNVTFSPTINNVLPAGVANFFNKSQSAAVYTQAEVHLLPNWDLVGGMRETKDWKSGRASIKPPLADPTFKYVNTKPSYLIGTNYKPTDDTMVYLKFSTAFVSGGNVAGIPFDPETVSSWEVGFKGEFFEHRVRTNIALYDAVYRHLQDSEGGSTFKGAALIAQYPFIPQVGTFIVDQGGEAKSKGVEFEGTWAAGHGFTTGTNVSYSDTHYENVNPSVDNPAGIPPVPTLIPKWQVGLWGEYQYTFANDLRGMVRMDANWRSTILFNNPALAAVIPAYANFISTPATWLVNGRATLSGFKAGPMDAEVSLWAKNLTNDKSPTYVLMIPGLIASATYQEARTFGIDVDFKY
jgi:iron complex outermembrane receptor protein